MATSGTIQQAITTGYRIQIAWAVDSQSVANNTSTVTAKVQLVSTGSSYTIVSSATKSGSLTINGTTYNFTFSASLSGNQTKTLFTKTVTISHASDGTKTCAFSATCGINVTLSGTYYGNVTASGNGTFNTIARASTISSVTASVAVNGTNAVTVAITRASSSFTHTVVFTFGSYSQTVTGVGTSTSYAIPTTWLNAIPNGTSGTAKVTVTTYSGGTKIGSAVSKNFTLTVPSTVVPTISAVTLAEGVSGLAAQFGGYVQSKSKLSVKITAAGALSSTIKSYKTVVQGVTFTGASITSGFLMHSGTSTVTITVTDSRGRTASTTRSITVIPYVAPKITSFQGFRCLANGTENYEGTYVNSAVNFSIAAVSNKNTSSYKLEYKLQTASTWTELKSGSGYTLNSNIISTSGAFSVDSSYDIRLTVTDYFITVVSTFEIPTAFTLLDFNKSGKGLAFGKVSELTSGVEFALPVEFAGTTKLQGNRYAFSSPGVAGTAGLILMAKISITAANADTPITFVFSQRQKETPMTVHVRLSNSTATASSIGSIKYEGTNYGAFLAKTNETTWDLYVQKASTYDTITLQDWYTSYTMNSRISVTFPGTLVDAVPTPFWRATPAVLDSIIDCLLPVGTIIQRYDHADPNEMYPGTTWVRVSGAFPWWTDGSGQIGLTGGERNVTLTVNQIPAHSHGSVYSQHAPGTKSQAWYTTAGTSLAYGAVETGGGAAHNNMPPYIQISAWRRTA